MQVTCVALQPLGLTMSATSRFPFLPYLFACLLGLFALSGFWYGLGQPVILPDAATPTHKLQCASYTPFDKDQSPFDVPFKLRPERMDADLALLATRFECIRTYSMTGLEALPDLARKHGLKLMIGAWVNSNPVDTEKEVDLLIKSANANPDVVSAVIVGNEALLRKEVTGAQLAKLINKVKSQVKQPVTYADVWEFWLKHPEIAPAVDFLTIHLLPYWKEWLAVGGLIFLGTLMLGGRVRTTRSALVLPLLGALAACSIGAWGDLARVTTRFASEWLWVGLLTALNLLVLAHAALTLSARAGWRERAFNLLERRAGWLVAAAGFAAAVMMLEMVFDPRYRSFTSMAFVLPALVYLCRPVSVPRREIALLTFIVGAGIAPQLYQEGLQNQQAWGWALVSGLMVGALWLCLRVHKI